MKLHVGVGLEPMRSFLERWTSLASGIIPTLNHDSRFKKRGH
jgi:hypothetical protein